MFLRVALPAIAAACPATAGLAQQAWTPSGPVPGRGVGEQNAVLAFDSARSVSVLYAGAETYELSAAGWQVINTPSNPGLLNGAMMEFDAARGVMVLHGGYLSPTTVDITWEYDGVDWALVSAAGPAIAYGVMSFDPGTGRMVLFHPSMAGTWEYDGATANWNQVLSVGVGPPTWWQGRMEYDPALDQHVAVGSQWSLAGAVGFQTWTFDSGSTTWTQLTAPGPLPRLGPALAYDSTRELLVLHGGAGNSQVSGMEVPLSDTWVFDATLLAWAPDNTINTLARTHSIMIFDEAQNRLVLVGGHTHAAFYDNATWVYGPSTLGTNYCTSTPHPAGGPCRMSAAGSLSIADNGLLLVAEDCVPGQPGIFFYGQNQTQVAFGDGYRCVADPAFRLFPFRHANSLGYASFDFDFDEVTPGGGFGPLIPGAWNFQFWYRNPDAGNAGFNLSDGLSLTFTP